jgi:hypothetical protein
MMYEFRGKATLTGMYFLIEADSMAEAIAKAKRGEITDTEDSGAEMSDWEIFPGTVREIKDC